MLSRLTFGLAPRLTFLALLLAPVAALAQAAAVAVPESVAVPTSWREVLWSAFLLPLLGLLWNELRMLLAARRQTAQATRDQNTRAMVEDMLYRVIDAVGAPIMADLQPVFARATDPAGPGGAAITGDEWVEIWEAIERELREVLSPDKLDLVMKAMGLNAAVRLIGTWLLKRYAMRQSVAPGSQQAHELAVYGVSEGGVVPQAGGQSPEALAAQGAGG